MGTVKTFPTSLLSNSFSYLRLSESFFMPGHERNVNHLDSLNNHGCFNLKLLSESRDKLLYGVVLIATDLPFIPQGIAHTIAK